MTSLVTLALLGMSSPALANDVFDADTTLGMVAELAGSSDAQGDMPRVARSTDRSSRSSSSSSRSSSSRSSSSRSSSSSSSRSATASRPATRAPASHSTTARAPAPHPPAARPVAPAYRPAAPAARPAPPVYRSGAPAYRPAPPAARPAAPAYRPAAPAYRPAAPAYRPAAPAYRPAPSAARPAAPRPSAGAPAAPYTTRPAAIPATGARRGAATCPPPQRTTTAVRAGGNQCAADAHTRANGDRPASSAPSVAHHAPPSRYAAPRRVDPGFSRYPHVRPMRPAPGYYYPHVRPYHGIFVYGPRPVYHSHYAQVGPRPPVAEAHLPKRRVDRDDTLAIGVRSGSYISGYKGGSVYGDLGLGLTARYRPDEALGIEVALTHHNQTFDVDTERAQTVLSASAMVFVAPWSRISPFVVAGVTADNRVIGDDFVQGGRVVSFDTRDTLWGPHIGAGVELAIGKRLALDLEARYIGYLNRDQGDPSVRGALQTNAGLLFHF